MKKGKKERKTDRKKERKIRRAAIQQQQQKTSHRNCLRDQPSPYIEQEAHLFGHLFACTYRVRCET